MSGHHFSTHVDHLQSPCLFKLTWESVLLPYGYITLSYDSLFDSGSLASAFSYLFLWSLIHLAVFAFIEVSLNPTL